MSFTRESSSRQEQTCCDPARARSRLAAAHTLPVEGMLSMTRVRPGGRVRSVRAASVSRRLLRAVSIATTVVMMVTLAVVGAPVGRDAAAAESAQQAPVVFILDASGSMARTAAGGRTRMDVAKQALKEAVAGLPEGTQAGLLVFGTGTGNEDAERSAGCQDVKTLVPLGRVDDATVSAQVDGIRQSGFTPIGPSLRVAFSMIPQGSPGSVVLISDGVDTCAPPPSCEIAAQLHRENPKVAIHVVGFGIDDDEAAQQQMTCIGGVGGGTAVSASDPAQLISRLRAATVSSPKSSQLSQRGMRGVEIGMSLDEVRAAVDGARVGKPKDVDGVIVIEVDCGWGTVQLRNNRVWLITPKDAGTSTAEGFRPGDTLERAVALYGEAVDRSSGPDGASAVYQLRPGSPLGYRMVYDAATGKVKFIVVCRCVPASFIAAADPSTWEITYDGVGPLVLGMSTEEATAVLPGLGPGQIRSGELRWALPNTDFDVRSLGGGGSDGGWLDAAFDGSGRLVGLSVSRPAEGRQSLPDGALYPSVRGIRLGDGMPTVVNAFPGGSTFQVHAAGRSDYVMMNREGHVLVFAAATGNAYKSFGEAIRGGTLTAVTVATPAAASSAPAGQEQSEPAAAPQPTVQTPTAPPIPGFPAELVGRWCSRGSSPYCFDVAEFFRNAPDAFVADTIERAGATTYVLCMENNFMNSCTTTHQTLLEYFPAGVGWDCVKFAKVEYSGGPYPGCSPDFTRDHDVSVPRLVARPNHIVADLRIIDSPPLYRQ